ncbi:MAG: DUF362 domain-containing protein [Gemmatimonadota bacterium]
MLDRRDFLKATAGAAVLAALPGCSDEPKWSPSARRKPSRSRVAVLSAGDYQQPLEDVVRRGVELFDLPLQGRRVLLKPNFVEVDPGGVINTHPAVVAAAIEAFRSLGAEVIVGEGAGHRRDNEYLLTATGIGDVLRETGARFVDLNNDAVRKVRLRSRFTEFGELYLPESVMSADLFVSMPKMKTHHWAGLTLSMKNLFGIVPGSIYGWPKNPLHWAGIHESILDLNAILPMPRFNIVDGIVGMEGNGPIQGEPVPSGVLVFGEDPVAVDATCARLMSVDPVRVRYLQEADAFLGNLAEDRVDQLGETVSRFTRNYRVLENFHGIKAANRMTAG